MCPMTRVINQRISVPRDCPLSRNPSSVTDRVLEYFAQLPPCLIGIEACGSAHYWARELSKLGHTVKLIATQYVMAS